MTDTTKIAIKIKALIAKANSSGHEAEAVAFMAKAYELLEQHQISLGELEDSDDPVRVHTDGLERTSKDPTWHRKLYAGLGALYGCKVVYAFAWVRGQDGSVVELTGRESAVITVNLMYPWVKSQCEAHGRALAKIYPEMSSSQHARRVGNALSQRCSRLARDNASSDASRAAMAVKNALVTVDRVTQVFDNHYSNLRSSASRAVKSSAAARAAASTIGLHRQTGSAKTLQLA